MNQLIKILRDSKQLEESDVVLTEAVVKSLAAGLFAAQATGLIRLPAGDLTMGEIESKLDTTAATFVQKLIESKPPKD